MSIKEVFAPVFLISAHALFNETESVVGQGGKVIRFACLSFLAQQLAHWLCTVAWVEKVTRWRAVF